MAIQFHCTGCGQPIEVDDEYAGRVAVCPHCQQVTSVPRASTYVPGAMTGGGFQTPEPAGIGTAPPTPLPPVQISAAPARGRGLAHYAFVCTGISGLLFVAVAVLSFKVALEHGALTTQPTATDLERIMKEFQSSRVTPWLSAAGCGMLFFAICGFALSITALVHRRGLSAGGTVGLALCLLFCGGVLLCNCASVFFTLLSGVAQAAG